jgi:hypothetical protein
MRSANLEAAETPFDCAHLGGSSAEDDHRVSPDAPSTPSNATTATFSTAAIKHLGKGSVKVSDLRLVPFQHHTATFDKQDLKKKKRG